MARVYYNEIDSFAAEWLRQLIAAGAIADGDVDERDIRDVSPGDLDRYTQCHFFAGIGGWSYALRSAGWPDDRPVWTGSCPCQPFSSAGKRGGVDDERHLWPAWFHLIEQRKPDTIFGEQVEAAIRLNWLDLVQDDLEGIGYAFAPVPFPAASVGAPHIRQRLYFVADSTNLRRDERRSAESVALQGERAEREGQYAESRDGGELSRRFEGLCRVGELGNSNESRSQGRQLRSDESSDQCVTRPSRLDGLTNGFWRDAEWLWCRDAKYRPTQPGLFPLAYGVSARVGRLRGYGNAIVAPQATAFVEAYMEVVGIPR